MIGGRSQDPSPPSSRQFDGEIGEGRRLSIGPGAERQQNDVCVQLGIKIPLRDGVHLGATLYLPKEHVSPTPVIFTLTPYIAQSYHAQGVYFATHGYPFLTVDVRGRGASTGVFRPLINEANDVSDVVQWLGRRPYCNGQVTMWGGSYSGYVQWAAAKELPPHLATIVPVAAPCVGIDFPINNNIAGPYILRWLTFVSGRTSQEAIFADQSFWSQQFRRWFEAGVPFKDIDAFLGSRSEIFQEWLAHPHQGAYWDSYNPSAEQYAQIIIPVLTITGIYDADQPGALMHYREHLKHRPDACHYLIIGPWDHAGTRTPKQEFCGLKTGPASLVDLPKLHLQWYEWTLRGGPRPEFLRTKVAYYVMGAEEWRYAQSLEEVTARSAPFYLGSRNNPVDVFQSGSLSPQKAERGGPDSFVYDPSDVSLAQFESTLDPASRADQRMVYASSGRQLIYHSEPLSEDTEVCGFFRLSVWIAIDQPDTDFRVSVHEIGLDGGSVLLTTDSMRARYRESLREPKLIGTTQPLPYEFTRFMFTARRVRKGSRLRLVIGPINSIFSQKNYNSGGAVAAESMSDARPVTVQLFHDEAYPSALYVPFGRVGH